MTRCSHQNIQQFTEICLDCGRNIHETDEEFLIDLHRRLKQKGVKKSDLEHLEKHLGINPKKDNDQTSFNNW